jgi:hypothetical protein
MPYPFRYLSTAYAPIGLWNFNESMSDLSGNGYHLTVEIGTERYCDVVPGLRGFLFDGSTTIYHNATPAALRITGDLTIETIISPDTYSTGTDRQVILQHGVNGDDSASTTNDAYQILLEAVNNRLIFFSEHGVGVNDVYTILDGVAARHPVLIAAIRESNVITFYVNGVQIGASSSALTAPDGGSASKLRVGGYTGGSATQFAGGMATLKIINRALTPAEVLAEAGVAIRGLSLGPHQHRAFTRWKGPSSAFLGAKRNRVDHRR